MSAPDLSQTSLLDLFRREAEEQGQVLSQGLLALERDPRAATHLESCMRAAHSIKGAARIVGLDTGVRLAHAMENIFVAAQRETLLLHRTLIDQLLRGLDLLRKVAVGGEERPDLRVSEGIAQCVQGLQHALESRASEAAAGANPVIIAEGPISAEERADSLVVPTTQGGSIEAELASPERVLRVTAKVLNRLLGLAGESLVESRRLQPFSQALLRLKRLHEGLNTRLERVQTLLETHSVPPAVRAELADTRQHAIECHRLLSERLSEFDHFDRRAVSLSQRLYEEAISCRMRPFVDGTRAFPRMVRDLARGLRKEVRLQIAGESTQVDRDILERLDAPLGHLVRNAVDHGIEQPEARQRAGKPPEGLLQVEARQSAGHLLIEVRDDGAGIDRERLKRRIAERGLAPAGTLEALSDSELFDFLLLPGFTLTDTVTEISGRGVGLDVVRELLKQVRGKIRIASERGRGTQFQLQLPLTLSVVRSLLFEVAGEPYALPLAGIVRTLKIRPETLAYLEGRPHFDLHGRRVGLLAAHQVLEGGESPMSAASELCVIVIGEEECAYGLLVDRLLGERELVVHLLDPRLGKIQDISAASLMEDGSPVLILDIEDLKRSIEKLAQNEVMSTLSRGPQATSQRRKRVLVVEDSLTVRELERKLLANAGYEVEVAVDGMDGWNAIRAREFDLIVTDIDMPRLDGLELVRLIRQDSRARHLRVMIVSYKDRPEDRSRGLDAGADFYLAKSSFHDESLIHAVSELIGEAA